MDWLDLLTVQVTLKSRLQHHSLKASILQRSAFFMVQFSHLYMTTGKTIALTVQTFFGKVMPLLLNMLFRSKRKVSLRRKCSQHHQIQPGTSKIRTEKCPYDLGQGSLVVTLARATFVVSIEMGWEIIGKWGSKNVQYRLLFQYGYEGEEKWMATAKCEFGIKGELFRLEPLAHLIQRGKNQ